MPVGSMDPATPSEPAENATGVPLRPRTGTNHYSSTFTYDCIAWSRDTWIDPSQYGWIGHDFHDPFLHERF